MTIISGRSLVQRTHWFIGDHSRTRGTFVCWKWKFIKMQSICKFYVCFVRIKVFIKSNILYMDACWINVFVPLYCTTVGLYSIHISLIHTNCVYCSILRMERCLVCLQKIITQKKPYNNWELIPPQISDFNGPPQTSEIQDNALLYRVIDRLYFTDGIWYGITNWWPYVLQPTHILKTQSHWSSTPNWILTKTAIAGYFTGNRLVEMYPNCAL